jgi:hypothetical protein
MRGILFVVLMAVFGAAVSQPAYAKNDSFKRPDATHALDGAHPVPNTYSLTDPNSLVLDGLKNKKSACVCNGTSSWAAFNFDNGSLDTPPAVDVGDYYVPPQNCLCVDTAGSSRLFIRSDEAAITSGRISGGAD